jgi:hypothetical protein
VASRYDPTFVIYNHKAPDIARAVAVHGAPAQYDWLGELLRYCDGLAEHGEFKILVRLFCD